MKQKHADKWAKARRHGQLKFILLVGVLLLGGMMSFGGLFLPITGFAEEWSDITVTYLTVHAVAWAFAGLVFGKLMWMHGERSYAKHLQEHDSRSESVS